MFLDGQARQESIHIAFGKLAGMPVLVERDVPANPVNVGVFRYHFHRFRAKQQAACEEDSKLLRCNELEPFGLTPPKQSSSSFCESGPRPEITERTSMVLATGTAWREHAVRAGPVIYLAREGQQRFGRQGGTDERGRGNVCHWLCRCRGRVGVASSRWRTRGIVHGGEDVPSAEPEKGHGQSPWHTSTVPPRRMFGSVGAPGAHPPGATRSGFRWLCLLGYRLTAL